MNKKDLRIFGLIILNILLAAALGYLMSPVIDNLRIHKNQIIINNSDCINLSLEDTADCMVNYVKTFYNYTISDDDPSRSLEDIKEFGGDCYDYSLIYLRMAKQFGYSGERATHFNQETKIGHSYAKIYDNDLSYCILDNDGVIGCAQMKRGINED